MCGCSCNYDVCSFTNGSNGFFLYLLIDLSYFISKIVVIVLAVVVAVVMAFHNFYLFCYVCMNKGKTIHFFSTFIFHSALILCGSETPELPIPLKCDMDFRLQTERWLCGDGIRFRCQCYEFKFHCLPLSCTSSSFLVFILLCFVVTVYIFFSNFSSHIYFSLCFPLTLLTPPASPFPPAPVPPHFTFKDLTIMISQWGKHLIGEHSGRGGACTSS